MIKIRLHISLSILVLLACFGCRGSSEIEMNQAQKAMEKARSLHAEEFASSNFEQAQTAWDHAQTAEKEGRTGAAKVLFTSARIYFGKAADIAKAKQETLSRELSAMQLVIGSNLDQVKSDLLKNNLSSRQRSQVDAIVSEVDKSNDLIKKLVIQEDLQKAVATAKDLQTKLYHAQLILAGQKIK